MGHHVLVQLSRRSRMYKSIPFKLSGLYLLRSSTIISNILRQIDQLARFLRLLSALSPLFPCIDALPSFHHRFLSLFPPIHLSARFRLSTVLLPPSIHHYLRFIGGGFVIEPIDYSTRLLSFGGFWSDGFDVAWNASTTSKHVRQGTSRMDIPISSVGHQMCR